MRLPLPRTLVLFLLLTSLAGRADAQVDFIGKLFEPKIFRVTNDLRAYIRNDLQPVTHDRQDELRDVDLIFMKAMDLSGKEISTALLASSFAVLNRTDIRPSLPLLGVVILPLPAEDSVDSRERIAKLPRYFFPDSPPDKWGDSDKLVHFFGSAYLTYETGTRKLPDAIGKLIENGEVALKLDSVTDPRDVFANRLGQQFGYALSDGRDVVPSDFLSAKFIKK